MAAIQELRGKKGRSFKVSIRQNGHRPVYRTFATLKAAQRFVVRLEDDIEAGKAGVADLDSRHTVGEAIDRYIEFELPKKVRDAKDRRKHLAWWREKLANRKLSELAPPEIVALRDELLNGKTIQGKPRQPATVNRYLADLSHVFTVVVKDFGWLEHSPTARVRKLREPRGRVRFLSDDDRSRHLATCRDWKQRQVEARERSAAAPEPFYLLAIVLLALSTGMRRGEIEKLRWSEVDWVRSRVVLEHTKNGERRSIPLVGDAKAELSSLFSQRESDSEFVFASAKRGFEGQPKSFQREWLALLKASKIDNFRFHDLRHSCASYLAMNGSTLTDIAAVLGHKTLQMVKRYAHLTDSHVQGVVADMSSKFIDAHAGERA